MATTVQTEPKAAVAPPSVVEGGLNRWWRVVGGVLMNLALGSLYAWSMFAGILKADAEFAGNTLAQLTLTFTISVFVFALAFVVAGRMQDKFGPLWVSVIGGVLVSLGFFMSGRAHSLMELYLWFGVVGGMGFGFGYATPIPVMAKWFPDKRGLAVGLAVAGFGAGSAIFGKWGTNMLIPTYGWRSTFEILGGVFFVMTMIAAVLLRNPRPGYKPAGWTPPAVGSKGAATTYEFTPAQTVKTSAFYFMWLAYALGCSAGLMVISQLIPFFKETLKTRADAASLAGTAFIVGAIGNAAGRILSGWMSDALGRLNVLRLLIGCSAVGMLLLPLAGGNVALLYALIFAVYWCFGTQLSLNASTAADFWGTKNVGMNYGMLFTAYGVAGIIGPMIGGKLHDLYQNYAAAFYAGSALAVVALICEFLARRPKSPDTILFGDGEAR